MMAAPPDQPTWKGVAVPPRPRRRAVGPPGGRPPQDEPRLDEPERTEPPPDDDERFRAERPPHHDREQ
jgi:hypothetical protein